MKKPKIIVRDVPSTEIPVDVPVNTASNEDEAPKAAPAPETTVEKRPFAVMIPTSTFRVLSVIAKAEGTSVSEIILDAVARADLKARARKALAALAAEIE